jgi:hypothetical protein
LPIFLALKPFRFFLLFFITILQNKFINNEEQKECFVRGAKRIFYIYSLYNGGGAEELVVFKKLVLK